MTKKKKQASGSPTIPEAFLNSMKDLLGEEYEGFLHSLDEPPHRGLRLNLRKWSEEEAAGAFPELSEKIPWAAGGRLLPENFPASRLPEYHAGLYYIQEASAMSPGDALPLSAGDRVLDLCAAPGGKATQLASRMQGGVLYANDISASRARFLLKNLEMAGMPDLFVTAETPERLAERLPEFFQAVLVDAPCSGEGMFHRDTGVRKEWLERGPAYYAPLQAGILDQAALMTSPGGYVLFSTCTFSRRENEDNVEAFLDRHPDFTLCPVPQKEGFSDGFLPGTVRIWPHRARGEGHFLALLHKAGERRAEKTPDSREAGNPERNRLSLPRILEKFPERLKSRELFAAGGNLYALPPGEKVPPGLRYLRTGLELGKGDGDRFHPSQALAMAMEAGEYPDTVCFPRGDVGILRYLRGETVDCSSAVIRGDEGWVLVCLDRFPLGWAARNGMQLKNRLNPGWIER